MSKITKNKQKENHNKLTKDKLINSINNTYSDKLENKISLHAEIIKSFTDKIDLEEPKEQNLFSLMPINSLNTTLIAMEQVMKEDINNSNNNMTNNRLKAIEKIKSNKIPSREQIQKLAEKKVNEELNPKTHISKTEIYPNYQIEIEQSQVKNTLLDEFEQYYSHKLNNVKNYTEKNNMIFSSNELLDGINIKTRYVNGINKSSQILYNKEERWITFLSGNNIIIECLESAFDNNQIIITENYLFNDSNLNKELNLSKLVLSDNGKYLIAYSEVNPIIISIDVADIKQEKDFKSQNKYVKLINISKINHKFLNSAAFSSEGNFLIINSFNTSKESFISILDYFNNSILATTIIPTHLIGIKFNPYLSNYEFVTCGIDCFLFWRVTGDYDLQYQYGDLNIKNDKVKRQITNFNFTPPLSLTTTILLLLGFDNGEIIGIDTKTNSLLFSLNMSLSKVPFFDRPLIKNINYLFCGIQHFIVASSHLIRFYKLPNLHEMKHNNITLINNTEQDLMFDSNIISIDFDTAFSEAIIKTNLGSVYFVDFKTSSSVKLFSCLNIYNKLSEIKDYMILNNNEEELNHHKEYISQSSACDKVIKLLIKKQNNYNYTIRDEQANSYLQDINYIITAHQNGFIKIWRYPDVKLLSCFDVINEEIYDIDKSYSILEIASCYSSGLIRFFDLKENRLIGKFKSISTDCFKKIKYLPDDNFLFAIDNNSTIHLLKIESRVNLIIQVHQLINITGSINEIALDPFEGFNKFGLLLNDSFFSIFNRKFTNIMKNISYDNNVPQFYLYDKLNISDCFKDKELIEGKSLTEKYSVKFCTKNKFILYVLSSYYSEIVVRNYDSHQIIHTFKLSHSCTGISISPNSAYFIVVDCNGCSYLYSLRSVKEMLEDREVNISFKSCTAIGVKSLMHNIDISDNGKHVVSCSDFAYCVSSLEFNN